MNTCSLYTDLRVWGMGNGKAKGGAFERSVCVLLSEWWSGGKRTDIFWRSASSGGRATVRQKQGKRTEGSYGDIAALHPKAKPLTDFATIEMKRGYNRSTLLDLVDKKAKQKPTVFEGFLDQCTTSMTGARSVTWWLIHRRDQKPEVIYMPEGAYELLKRSSANKEHEQVSWVRVRVNKPLGSGGKFCVVVGMQLSDFLKSFGREDVENALTIAASTK